MASRMSGVESDKCVRVAVDRVDGRSCEVIELFVEQLQAKVINRFELLLNPNSDKFCEKVKSVKVEGQNVVIGP